MSVALEDEEDFKFVENAIKEKRQRRGYVGTAG